MLVMFCVSVEVWFDTCHMGHDFYKNKTFIWVALRVPERLKAKDLRLTTYDLRKLWNDKIILKLDEDTN